ncbi:hypothetical protein HIM_06882 [Hirsutella minnesotensis 3608]|uniref:Uncharacterized protein n=1 Tax=Hirsutella minnesotensis 3608 TaxID=1043627 RepID=A0A0F8A4L0_9HYPO|nr:hypothetical protein HIM_06882 [Hirsutella minnesotensis 3608]
MAAGYRFLTMFEKALAEGSPEHFQVCRHMREALDVSAQDRRRASEAARERRKWKTPAPRKPAEPLLVNVAPPGAAPVFKSNILPRRPDPTSAAGQAAKPPKVPTLSTTANGEPFIRLWKPQPRALSMTIKRNEAAYLRHLDQVVLCREEFRVEAEAEDAWEILMTKLAASEAGSGDSYTTNLLATLRADAHDHTASFAHSVRIGRLWNDFKFEHLRRTRDARGKAFTEIIEAQRIISEAWPDPPPEGGAIPDEIQHLIDSSKERHFSRSRPEAGRGRGRDDSQRPSVMVNNQPKYPMHDKLQAWDLLDPWTAPSRETHPPTDPYSTPAWTVLVRVFGRK